VTRIVLAVVLAVVLGVIAFKPHVAANPCAGADRLAEGGLDAQATAAYEKLITDADAPQCAVDALEPLADPPSPCEAADALLATDLIAKAEDAYAALLPEECSGAGLAAAADRRCELIRAAEPGTPAARALARSRVNPDVRWWCSAPAGARP
jgi:hypothetical protein